MTKAVNASQDREFQDDKLNIVSGGDLFGVSAHFKTSDRRSLQRSEGHWASLEPSVSERSKCIAGEFRPRVVAEVCPSDSCDQGELPAAPSTAKV